MNYKKLNNIIGWVVFAIATFVYIATAERTTSFWDCGEYIATAYKLQVGHPPGAPLFQMIGRFFSLFAFGDLTKVAFMVNIMSALCSSFTILFLFWSITYLAKKLIVKLYGEINNNGIISIMAAGVVGALAYTFSDSFWFSAVEGEVYAMSSFFTALVFWIMLKWDANADQPNNLKWIILIAYFIGLSVGVHMLNLLAIPAITYIYYFKRYHVTWKGIIFTGFLSIGILAVVMFIVIPGAIALAGGFERLFINSFGLPFNTGTVLYFLTLIVLIVLGLRYSHRKGKVLLNTIIISLTVILIGYSSFIMLVIRSNANTPIDENNPENAISLLAYLNREQYGDWPIFSGYYYNAPVVAYEDGKPTYGKKYLVFDGQRQVNSFFTRKEARAFVENSDRDLSIKGRYVVINDKKGIEPVYDERFKAVFPRMWSSQRSAHPSAYKQWAHKNKGEPIRIMKNDGEEGIVYRPTAGENLSFFMKYQVAHMYFRYFMWNFSGRQNDVQGHGNLKDGNWITGINFIDEAVAGPQNTITSDMAANKARNKFYMLPFILGLVGFLFHLSHNYKDNLVVLVLFIMTGLAIVVYLNQYPYQPRERDYAYAASFMAFSIWIGLGVIALIHAIQKSIKNKLIPFMVGGACLILVPGIMAAEGWDDHDRSKKKLALEVAKNYLNSCKKNSIVFTNGDNDTFPLWYAQEVEGVRTDVKIVNLSLFNTDWYVDQMSRKTYEAEGIPISMTKEQYVQGTRDMIFMNSDKDRTSRIILIQFFLDKIVDKYQEMYQPYIDAFNNSLLTAINNSKFKELQPNDYKAITSDEINMSQIVRFVESISGDAGEEIRKKLQINDDLWKIVVKQKDVLLENTIHDYIDIEFIMDWIKSDEEYSKIPLSAGNKLDFIPTKKIRMPVDSANAVNSGLVKLKEAGNMLKYIDWELEGRLLQKNNIMMLDFLYANNWERPVHYAVTTGPDSYNNLMPYFQHDGLVYTLVPFKHTENMQDDYLITMRGYGRIDVDTYYDILMEKFDYTSLRIPDVYYDETNRRPLTTYRSLHYRLAIYLSKAGDNERANMVMDHVETLLPDEILPYDMSSLPAVRIYYTIGNKEKGRETAKIHLEKFREEFNYYSSYPRKKMDIVENDLNLLFELVSELYRVLSLNEEEQLVAEVEMLAGQMEPYTTRRR